VESDDIPMTSWVELNPAAGLPRARSSAPKLLLSAAICLAMVLPFVAKPFHIDDRVSILGIPAIGMVAGVQR
jgi:hypothetical protein